MGSSQPKEKTNTNLAVLQNNNEIKQIQPPIVNGKNDIIRKFPEKPINTKLKAYCRIRCSKHFEKNLVLRDRKDLKVCLKCGKYSRAFQCQQCPFAICLECFNEPKEYYRFYCAKGHELKFQGNLGSHICDLCDGKIDSAYSCRECDFDLCLKCKKQVLDKFSAESLKCPLMHQKRALAYINKEGQCTNCKVDCDGYWFCKTCKFQRCIDCKSEQEYKFMKMHFQDQK